MDAPTFQTEYADETGAVVTTEFDNETDATRRFATDYQNLTKSPFAALSVPADAWEVIGYPEPLTVMYGVHAHGYDPVVGNWSLYLTTVREVQPNPTAHGRW